MAIHEQQRAEVRRRILEIARRRQRPGSGSSLAFLRERTAMRSWPDPGAALGDLPWAVVGAVATRHYMPERATADLDVLVAAEDGPEARRRLSAGGYRYVQELTVGGSTWAPPVGAAVDVLEGRAAWIRAALVEAQHNRDLQGLPVLPLPYLVLMKLQSGRVQDLSDITRMLGLADDAALERVREVVRRHEPDAVEDVEQMLLLGRLEAQE